MTNNTVTLTPVANDQQLLIRNLLQLYLYDFTEFTDVTRDNDGLFSYPYLDHYWREPDRYPFLIAKAGEPAGFALVRSVLDPATNKSAFELAEFFVLRMFRGQKVGHEAVQLLCDLLPGNWIVKVLGTNLPAYHFWQSALEHFNPTHELEDSGKVKSSNHVFTFTY